MLRWKYVPAKWSNLSTIGRWHVLILDPEQRVPFREPPLPYHIWYQEIQNTSWFWNQHHHTTPHSAQRLPPHTKPNYVETKTSNWKGMLFGPQKRVHIGWLLEHCDTPKAEEVHDEVDSQRVDRPGSLEKSGCVHPAHFLTSRELHQDNRYAFFTQIRYTQRQQQ